MGVRINFSRKYVPGPPPIDKEKVLTWVRMMVYIETAPEMAADACEREADQLYATMTKREQQAADTTYIRYCLNRMKGV